MKKISIIQEFDHSLDILLEAREERYKHLDKFPELKNIEIISEELSGEILTQVRKIHLGSSLPIVLVPLLPKGADVLVESSTFNKTSNTHLFEVMPDGGHGNIFTIKGESAYYSIENNRSARNYNITIKSKAFLVGSVVETAIGEIYSQNLRKDKRSIESFIKTLNQEKSSEPTKQESVPEKAEEKPNG